MGTQERKRRPEPARTQEETQRGERIRSLRTAMKWNQVEFAMHLGVDQSTVSDIERGAGFSADLLMRMAEVLGVTPSYVMRGVDEYFWPFQHIEVQEFTALDPEQRSLVEGRLMEYLSQLVPLPPLSRASVRRVQRRRQA